MSRYKTKTRQDGRACVLKRYLFFFWCECEFVPNNKYGYVMHISPLSDLYLGHVTTWFQSVADANEAINHAVSVGDT